MNWITRTTLRLAPIGALFSLLVFAADIPDALPAGFLEQLPTLLQMRDDEYEALLQFVEQENAAAKADASLTDAPAAQEKADEN